MFHARLGCRIHEWLEGWMILGEQTDMPLGMRRGPRIGFIFSWSAVSVWLLLRCSLHMVSSFFHHML
eukprot:1759187-Pyramimonas_sp.AAC.1